MSNIQASQAGVCRAAVGVWEWLRTDADRDYACERTRPLPKGHAWSPERLQGRTGHLSLVLASPPLSLGRFAGTAGGRALAAPDTSRFDGFPSGHAANSAAASAALVILLWPVLRRPGRVVAVSLAAAVTTVTALKRVFLGAQHPSGVIGGVILGKMGAFEACPREKHDRNGSSHQRSARPRQAPAHTPKSAHAISGVRRFGLQRRACHALATAVGEEPEVDARLAAVKRVSLSGSWVRSCSCREDRSLFSVHRGTPRGRSVEPGGGSSRSCLRPGLGDGGADVGSGCSWSGTGKVFGSIPVRSAVSSCPASGYGWPVETRSSAARALSDAPLDATPLRGR